MHKDGHLAIYPGSFDPLTLGHLDVMQRSRGLFDRIIVGVGHHPGKDQLFSFDERFAMVRKQVSLLVEQEPDGAPIDVRTFDGLTVDFARSVGASALLRGVRNLSDLQYEIRQAVTNREVADLETIFLVADQQYAYTSSTLIKQITAMGKDLTPLRSMVPEMVVGELARKKAERHPVLERLLADNTTPRED